MRDSSNPRIPGIIRVKSTHESYGAPSIACVVLKIFCLRSKEEQEQKRTLSSHSLLNNDLKSLWKMTI